MGIRSLFDKHFSYSKSFVKAVAEKHGFNEEQTKRFAEFCENFKIATHNVNKYYKSMTHEMQQAILSQVIEGIKMYPRIDDVHMAITKDSQGIAKLENPKVDGEYVKYPEMLNAELSVKGAAAWFNTYGKKKPAEK